MYVGWGDPDDEGYEGGSGASGFDCTAGGSGSGVDGLFWTGGRGFYKFTPNTVNVSYHWIVKHSPITGNRYAAEGIMILRGRLVQCDIDGGSMDSISDQIDKLIDAFSYDGRTLALYNDDGTVTQHVLPNDVDTLVDGPKVVRYSWPRGDRGEYSDHRSFYIEVRGLYDYGNPCDTVNGIVEYHERLRYEGLGGPQWMSLYDQSGTWCRWTGSPITVTRLVQSGYSKGWGGFVLPLDPVEPLYTHWDQAWEDYGSPSVGSHKSKEYTMRWCYPMTLQSFYGAAVPHSPLTKV